MEESRFSDIHGSALKAQTQVVISLITFILLFLTQLLFSLVPVIKIEINTAKLYVVPHSHFTKILLSNTEQYIYMSFHERYCSRIPIC